MKLYHGSTVAVRRPSLRLGRPNADFGKGFYTTSNPEQAERWAHIKQEREDAPRAIVSVYEFAVKDVLLSAYTRKTFKLNKML